jgi:hypothetical protein
LAELEKYREKNGAQKLQDYITILSFINDNDRRDMERMEKVG